LRNGLDNCPNSCIVIHKGRHKAFREAKETKQMKLYTNAKNQIVCDSHASIELKEIRRPIETLEIWAMIQERQEHFSKFCIECNKA
jgi:hypothetical protein